MISFKKHTAILLAFLLFLFSALPTSVMAGLSNSDAELCGTLGMLVGEGNGLTDEYLAKTPTRIKAAVLFLRLKGLENEATNYNGASNFDDVNEASWATNIMAYLKAHPELGMVGMGDNKFNPNANISVQAYYKILLTALGYTAGTDFQWEDTINFANTKGLNKVANVINFTVGDMAIATVEALKANIKGSSDTLAGVLVRNGVFTSTQVSALTAANISLVTVNCEAKIATASTITVTFNSKVADKSKLTYSLSKDGTIIDSLTSSWSDDGLVLTIKRPIKFDIGTYNLKILYDNKLFDTKTIEVEKERIASIKFSPEIVVLTSDIKGEVKYTATNQYGEDVSNSELMRKVIWATSVDSVTVDIVNTKLVVTKNGTASVSQLKDTGFVTISGYDGTNAVVTAQLNVSDGYGIVKDIKFLGITNPDGKSDLTVDTQEHYYIDYEAYDESGKEVDSYTILSNVGNLGLYSTNDSIKAHVVRDPDNTSKALIEIDTHTVSGTADITGVVLSTGKKAVINVEVKKGTTLTKLVIKAPDTGVPINERVEIPFEAYDQNGKAITNYDLINGKVIFAVSAGGTANIVGERSQTGDYILTGYFDQVSTYSIKVVIMDNNSSTDYTIVTRAASVPTTISSIDRNIVCDGIVKNGVIRADFVNNPAFTILDQNGNQLDLSQNNIFNGKYYYIYVSTADSDKVDIYANKCIAYKDHEIELSGGDLKGTTTLTFELCSDSDLDPDDKEVLDVKDVTVSNIDRNDITSYSFGKIPTLYANPKLISTDKYTSITAQEQQYAYNVKVYGQTASTKKVALNPTIGAGNNILTMTVTDSNKFDVDLTQSKILAKPYGNNTTATDKLTATIQGANGVIKTITTAVNSSTEAPVSASIEAVISPDASIKRSKDTFTMSLSTFKSSIMGKELRSFDSSGDDAEKADLYFVIKDQYGVTGLTPTYFALTVSSGDGTLEIDPTTGEISGKPSSDDQYIITAVTNNGLTKAITINIQ